MVCHLGVYQRHPHRARRYYFTLVHHHLGGLQRQLFFNQHLSLTRMRSILIPRTATRKRGACPPNRDPRLQSKWGFRPWGRSGCVLLRWVVPRFCYILGSSTHCQLGPMPGDGGTRCLFFLRRPVFCGTQLVLGKFSILFPLPVLDFRGQCRNLGWRCLLSTLCFPGVLSTTRGTLLRTRYELGPPRSPSVSGVSPATWGPLCPLLSVIMFVGSSIRVPPTIAYRFAGPIMSGTLGSGSLVIFTVGSVLSLLELSTMSSG